MPDLLCNRCGTEINDHQGPLSEYLAKPAHGDVAHCLIGLKERVRQMEASADAHDADLREGAAPAAEVTSYEVPEKFRLELDSLQARSLAVSQILQETTEYVIRQQTALHRQKNDLWRDLMDHLGIQYGTGYFWQYDPHTNTLNRQPMTDERKLDDARMEVIFARTLRHMRETGE